MNVFRSEFCLILFCLADVSKPKKRVEDVMPIATGHEREELEAELEVYLLPSFLKDSL